MGNVKVETNIDFIVIHNKPKKEEEKEQDGVIKDTKHT